jgi:HEAT repeat protein
MGPTAVPPLLTALKSKEPKIRDYAIMALGAIGAPAIDPLLALLEDENPDTRSGVAAALGFIRDPRAVEPLITALSDKDPGVRAQVVSALMTLGGPAVDPLMKSLQVHDSDVQQGAALILGMIQDPRAVEPLIVTLKDPNPEVRAWVVWALGRIGDKRAAKPLQELLEGESVQGQQAENKASQSDKKENASASNGSMLHEVSMLHFFLPRVLTINVGDIVKWTNNHGIEHSVKSLAKTKEGLSVFFSGQLMPNNAYVHQFTEPGTYDYVCGLHPPMVGTIIVKPKPGVRKAEKEPEVTQ